MMACDFAFADIGTSGCSDALECSGERPVMYGRVGGMSGKDHWSEFRDLEAVTARLGITVVGREVQVGSGRDRGYRMAVEIRLPRRQRVLGHVMPRQVSLGDRLRGIFQRSVGDGRDPVDTGFERFVEVQPKPGQEAVMDEFFKLPIARRAALELIRMGCRIEFTSSTLWANASCLCHPPKLPDQREVATRLAAIAAPLAARRVIPRRRAPGP